MTGCSGIDGNGERIDQTRDTAAFSRVRSDCELDVEIAQGGETSLTVSIDSNLQDLVETRVQDDTLFVNLKDDVDRVVDGPHVMITVPALTAAKLGGSGSMTLGFDQPERALDLYLSGSGSLRFDGTTAALGASLSGSGDLLLSGETSNAELRLSGSGAIRARNLKATSAAIDLSGSGNVAATVLGSASVSLSGSGEIDLYGGASLDAYHHSGSGDLHRH